MNYEYDVEKGGHFDLKPCPFCGGKATTGVVLDSNYFLVYCTDCGARTAPVYMRKRRYKGDSINSLYIKDYDYAKAASIHNWNIRAGE